MNNPRITDTEMSTLSAGEQCSTEQFLALMATGEYEFLDFGCSHGGSIKQAKKLFRVGRNGLGIDIDPKKIQLARETDIHAVNFDIRNIPNKKLVRFTVMSHFLEHVPDLKDVKLFIAKACMSSKEYVFIKQPYFDADGYLLQNGLKCFWSDWHGHPNCMTSLAFHSILSALKKRNLFENFSIHARRPIVDSSDESIHSIESPMDQHQYCSDSSGKTNEYQV